MRLKTITFILGITVACSTIPTHRLAAQRPECRTGTSSIIGEVNGLPNSPALVMWNVGLSRCETYTAPDGTFTLHSVPAGPALVRVESFGYCVVPEIVTVTARDTMRVELQAQEGYATLDDIFLVLRGNGYVPPPYDKLHCEELGRQIEAAHAGQPVPPSIPTPDGVMEFLSSYDPFTELVHSLPTDQRCRVNMFYGATDSTFDVGSTQCSVGGLSGASLYVVVRRSQPDSVDIQFALISDTHGSRILWNPLDGSVNVIESW